MTKEITSTPTGTWQLKDTERLELDAVCCAYENVRQTELKATTVYQSCSVLVWLWLYFHINFLFMSISTKNLLYERSLVTKYSG